jgi:WD40 repeat protein
VTCITALPTGHLVTGSSDKMIRVWNPEQEDDCKAVVEAGDLVLSLASYSP